MKWERGRGTGGASRRLESLLRHWGERLLGDRRQMSSTEQPSEPSSRAPSSPRVLPASVPGWGFCCSRLFHLLLLSAIFARVIVLHTSLKPRWTILNKSHAKLFSIFSYMDSVEMRTTPSSFLFPRRIFHLIGHQ